MVCDVPQGVTIEFPDTGLEVNPETVDIRIRERNHNKAQFKLPEDAGIMIGDYVDPWSLAVVNIDGVASHRMVFLPDSLSFRKNIQDRPRAVLELDDARRILDRTSVDRTYNGGEFEDAVATVLSLKEDPDGVINDFEIVDADSSHHVGDLSLTDRSLEIMTLGKLKMPGSFDFEGTLTEVMNDLTSEVEADWWVDDSGTLYIGHIGSRGQSFIVTPHSNDIVLSRYSVTQDNDLVAAVQLRADLDNDEYQTTSDPIPYVDAYDAGRPLKLIAVARNNDINGGMKTIPISKSFSDPEDVEGAATRRLMKESMEETSGSMEINGSASTDMDIIRQLNVGDLVYVASGVADECKQNVYTGTFMISDVHHKRDRAQGWRINVDVARYVDPDHIETDSVLYDPTKDKSYEDMDDHPLVGKSDRAAPELPGAGFL